MISCILIYSCMETSKPKSKYMSDYEYKKHRDLILDSLKSRNDTVILNFTFGMKESEYNRHIKKLITNNKLRQKSEIKINVGSQNYKVDGYQYDFYLSSKKYNSLLKGSFHQNKLNKVEIILYNVDTYTEDMLVDMYKSKYGDFLREEPESGSMIYFWIIDNLEIKIQYFITQGLIFITYNDLIVERHIEQIERDEKEKIINQNKELSKDTQNEI